MYIYIYGVTHSWDYIQKKTWFSPKGRHHGFIVQFPHFRHQISTGQEHVPALRGAEKSQCYGKWKVTIVVNNGFGMVNKYSVMVNNG